MSRLVVVLLSHLPEFYSCTMLLCSWVLSQHHHLLAYSMLMVSLGEPVGGELGRAVLVTEAEAFLGDMGAYSRGDGSQVRM